MKIPPTQQSLQWASRVVVGWQIIVVLPLLFVSCWYLLHENKLSDDWAVALLMLYPYVAISLYTSFRLLRDPQNGRLVALWLPILVLGLDLLTLGLALVSVWDGFTFFLFYWAMNLLYALYTVPGVILLLLPAVRRCYRAESEATVSRHTEIVVVSPLRWWSVITRVLALMMLTLTAIYAGMLSPYFFSTHLSESMAPDRRSRIIVVAYEMYGAENVGIYCWLRGRFLPRRIYVTSSSGDTWCYPQAKISWSGNSATIDVIGESDVKTFLYPPE